MTTQKIQGQTTITILAKLDGSNNVQLFELDSLMALDDSDTVKNKFGANSGRTSVSVQVVSTDDTVTVTDNSGNTWSQSTVPSGSNTVTLFIASTSLTIPGQGESVTDEFTIAVGSSVADPTVVIERGGSGNNVVIGARPRPR